MDANQFKAAIDGMSEAELCEVINALDRACEHAVQLKLSARLPECAAFGAIAGDLEYGLGIICGSGLGDKPASVPACVPDSVGNSRNVHAFSGGKYIMDTDAETSELQQQTAAEHKIQRIQFLSCLIIACQQKLEMAAEVFALAQRMLAEARDQLEVAQKALERAGADV